MTIYTLGPSGTYSHQATAQYFPNQNIQFLPNITAIFKKIGRKDFGIVPLENMIEGSVRETLDQLNTHKHKIYDTVTININHQILAQNKIFTTIASHPQALAQCRQFLNKKYPKLKTQSVSSTAKASQLASENSNIAAISNEFTCQDNPNLKIIKNHISDYPGNQTKFAIINREANPSPYQTSSIIITPIKDEAGVLIKLLYPFHEAGVNLSKIESRPSKKGLNQYIFYLDFEADYRQAKIRKIFTYLEKDLRICTIKVLGGSLPQNNIH